MVHLVIDATDMSRLAEFWAAALGWAVDADEPDECVVWPAGFSYPDPAVLPLVIVPVPEAKAVKNRVHLDLASASVQHQEDQVRRLRDLGAVPADVGQGEVPWVVLADPEGNEFCVLDPREHYRDTGPIAAIVMDCPDPLALAPFWHAAAGWIPRQSADHYASLRPDSPGGPFLELLRVPDAKTVKNRLHLDVAPFPGGETQAEAERLRQLGAAPADVGQHDVSWIVLTDPQGNEFCVLTPR